jgi:O-antigen/teichoic acid export membrane protein
VAGAIAAIVVSPYRLKLRFDRRAAGRYVRFSIPLLVTAAAYLVVDQGQVLAFDLEHGLAGAGFITIAATLTRYADRADQIVTSAIYPAVCALQGRTERLTELFEKSNRATMMWTLPFAAGLVLFAPDLVSFVLGNRWQPAVLLLQGLAVAAGILQIGFNWFSFYHAHGDTRPTAVDAAVGAAGFLLLAVPGLVLFGTWGFIVGRVIGVGLRQAVRAWYIHQLLPDANLARLALRALRPMAIAVGTTLLVRLALWGGERSAAQAAAEVVVFVSTYVAATLWLERVLIAEIGRTWRGGGLSQLAEFDGEATAPATRG